MFSIGPSSYPDLKGVDQVIATERMALQFWSVKVDFDAWMASKGRTGRLSANEGYRPKERCLYLWDNRAALGIVVAPPLTSRHYRNPNAIDFGITEPMGMNRALAPDEFTKLHELVELRGGDWTGQNFGEEWHHEMATRAEVLPPYPNARALAEAGPTPKNDSKEEEDDMAKPVLTLVQDKTTANGQTWLIDGIESAVWIKAKNDAELVSTLRPFGITQPGDEVGGKWKQRANIVNAGELTNALALISRAGGKVVR